MIVDSFKLNLLLKYVRDITGDIGCGEGYYSEFLVKRGIRCIGCDIDFEKVLIAKKRAPGEYVVCDANYLPFRDKVFHSLILYDIIEHLDDYTRLFIDAKRITKTYILVTVPNSDDFGLNKAGLTYSHWKDRTHKHEFTITKLIEIAKSYRLKIVEIGYCNPLSPFSIFIHLILARRVYRTSINSSKKLRWKINKLMFKIFERLFNSLWVKIFRFPLLYYNIYVVYKSA